MTAKVRAALSAVSEHRERLTAAPDDLADEKLIELRRAVEAAERELRAALEEDPSGADEQQGDEQDPETRERNGLLARATLAGFITAAAERRPVVGAEHEASAAFGCNGAIPMQMFSGPVAGAQVETRAQTDPPATTDVIYHPTIHPIFDQSIGGYLDVDMPMVAPGVQQYPVLTTSLTAGMVAKGSEAVETAAVYGTLHTVSPGRIGGGYRLRREDLAVLPRMEADLDMNIRAVMADTLDNQILNGDNTGANLNGVLTQLDDPNPAVTAKETFPKFLERGYVDMIDGKLARSVMDTRLLVGTATQKFAETLVHGTEAPFQPFASYARTNTGGLRSTNRIAAPASDVQQAVAVRALSPSRPAVLPVWNGLEAIRDEKSDARKGEIIVTLFALVGGPVLLRKPVYTQVDFKLA